MRDSEGGVAVFWDLDTCSIHPTTSGYDVVGKIRALSQKLGTVKSFKGYADLANLGIPSALQLRSELQSSGVSLIDCPATERRSISSKTMIVDMLAHAADNPPPATLLVIAGNDDLAYAVSILQLRQYQVVLVCPKDRVGQRSQASLYLDWFRDVLGSDFVNSDDAPPSSHNSRRSRSNTTGTASTAPAALTPSQDRAIATSESVVHGSFFSHPTGSSVSSLFHEDSDDPIPNYPDVDDEKSEGGRIDAEPSLGVVLSTIADGSPQLQRNGLGRIRASSPAPRDFLDTQQRPLSAPPSYSSFSPAPSPASPELYASMASGAFRPPRYLQDQIHSEDTDVFEGPSRLVSQPQSPGSTSASTITPWHVAPASNSPTTFDPLPTSRAHLSPDLPEIITLPTMSQVGLVSLPPSPSSVLPSLVETPDFSPRIIPEAIRPPPPGTSPEIPAGPISPQTPQAPPAIPLSHNPSPSLPVPTATPQSASTPLPIRNLTPTAVRTPTPAPASTLTPAPTTASAQTSAPLFSGSTPQSTPIKPTVQARPPALTVVPLQFKPLIKKLQELREKGDLQPFRPGLAAEMVSVLSKEMQETGVSTFTQFAQLAEQAGIVELPRPGEGLWIALRPELFDYHV